MHIEYILYLHGMYILQNSQSTTTEYFISTVMDKP